MSVCGVHVVCMCMCVCACVCVCCGWVDVPVCGCGCVVDMLRVWVCARASENDRKMGGGAGGEQERMTDKQTDGETERKGDRRLGAGGRAMAEHTHRTRIGETRGSEGLIV